MICESGRLRISESTVVGELGAPSTVKPMTVTKRLRRLEG